MGVATAGADEAAGRKVYSGTMCKPADGLTKGISYDLGIYNYSGSSKVFLCPVLNDAIQAGWASASVRVWGVGTKCWGVASPWSSLTPFLTPAATSSSPSLSTLFLGTTFFEDTEVGTTNNPLTDVYADYQIVCQVPNLGGIVRYYVREK